jgi:S1-C subfamily serine protease
MWCSFSRLRSGAPIAGSIQTPPPLKLTISPGTTSLFVNGALLAQDSSADYIFLEHARAARLFKDALPRQHSTDLCVDEIVNADYGATASIYAYQAVAFVPALVPVLNLLIPFPRSYHIRDQVEVRDASSPDSPTIREYALDYYMNIWVQSAYGDEHEMMENGLSRQVQFPESFYAYRMDEILEAMERDYDIYKNLEVSGEQRQGTPVEGASKAGAQPSIDAAVVRIKTDRSLGSGFFVTKDLIATNAHVVHGSREVWILFSGGNEYRGSLAYENSELDFALIRPSVQGTPLSFRTTPLVDGEGVMAVGFPQGRRTAAASTGTVRKIVECCVEHDALVAGGSSGGPLVDLDSHVIGINTALVKAKGDRKNESDRTWALKMSYILESLRQVDSGE